MDTFTDTETRLPMVGRAPMWLATTLGAAVIGMALAAVFMVQPIFAEVAAGLGIEVTEARYAFTLISITYAVAFFVWGPLIDRFSATRLAAGASILLAMALISVTLSQSVIVFWVAMASAGVFAAGMVAAMFSFMRTIAPSERVGIYMGYCLSATISGIIVGRTATGVLAATVGWLNTFAIFAALTALPAVSLLALAGSNVGAASRAQSNLRKAFTDSLRLFANPQIAALLTAGAALFVAYLGLLTFLTFHLQTPPLSVGSDGIGWISLAGAASVVVAPMAGDWSHRFGGQRVAAAGIILVTLSALILAIPLGIPGAVIGVAVLYTGVYICQPAVFYLITTLVPPQVFASASSLYLLVCLGAGSAASAALGPVWQTHGWLGITGVCATAAIGALILCLIAGGAADKQDNNL